MKKIETTALVLSALFVLGTAQESKAASIQPIAPAIHQENILLTHGGGHHGGGHGGGHHGWHGGGHHGWHGHRGYWGGGYWGGGGWYGPGFHRVCGFNAFGQYHCYRRYY